MAAKPKVIEITLKRGLKLFFNIQPYTLADELAAATRLKVIPKILESSVDLDTSFEEIVNAGTIKWWLTRRASWW